MLALAQPAAAKIVYTPANKEITPETSLNLDLNHDGINDFRFSEIYQAPGGYFFSLKIRPRGVGNAIWGAGKYASALSAGVSVGPKGKFQTGHDEMVALGISCGSGSCGYSTIGPWKNITNGYLGLKFSIQGEIHYGWARLNVTVENFGIYAMLTGYAYETVANKAIVTGRTKDGERITRNKGRANDSPVGLARPTATLGLLARGAAALDVWRRRDGTEMSESVERRL